MRYKNKKLLKLGTQGETHLRNLGASRDREGVAPARFIPDAMIDDFVARMEDYAKLHSLGKPTLRFAQNETHFGVALDWRDYHRAFSFSRKTWLIADYRKLSDKLRNAF
jgi:hypothetical protein